MVEEREIIGNILNNLSNEIIFYDLDGRIIYLNDVTEPNKEKRESLLGKTEIEYTASKGLNLEIANKRIEIINSVLENRIRIEFEENIINPNTNEKNFYIQELTPIFDSENKFLGVLRKETDITWRKKIESEFEYLAFHDSLTGLPNRRFLYKELFEQKNKNSGERKFVSIFLLDLDRFKAINDTLGHLVGDELIQSVAGRIINLISKNEFRAFVARLGGDEFVISIFGVNDLNEIEKIASKLINSFKNPFSLANHELFLTFILENSGKLTL